MFGAAARIAARPAAAAAGVAAANAAQGSAHARAPTQTAGRQAVHPPAHNNKLVDRDVDAGWLDVQLKDEVVLFQPFNTQELDQAADTVLALFSGASSSVTTTTSSSAVPIITEPDEEGAATSPSRTGGGSGRSSDDGGAGSDLADAYIEAAAAANAQAVASGQRAREREQLEGLMAITTRLLRRPGMQREVVLCMLEDEEVRDLMLRQCSDLDRYLVAAGIHTPQLLPPAAAAAAAAAGSLLPEAAAPEAETDAQQPQPQPRQGAGGAGGGPGGLVSKLVGAVAGAIERAGDALAFLGGWLRRHIAATLPFVGPADHQPQAGSWGEEQEKEVLEEEEEDGVEGVQRQEGGRARPRAGAQPRRGTDLVLGGVMALAVAVFAVAIIRRPLVLRQLSRRFR
ncbi:hypothetical protein HYH02_001127 [Chlamydomonas schloesseri]|uniref:Uncharacterized protein n=1 Tax=Chlamydomonas schloesseri TaxID=2026947 RepID=A0A836BC35_9CHLO|nr:hypothetical protein HYH02_001127 [Chlamydomonas schloesseri]|eukprot:KAG2454087.1 hypothetical protein HYH02_001127 [Chlamydomonas schloesseri]